MDVPPYAMDLITMAPVVSFAVRGAPEETVSVVALKATLSKIGRASCRERV